MRRPRSRASSLASSGTAPALRGGASFARSWTAACARSLAPLLALLLPWLVPAGAHAEPHGPFFEFDELAEPGYELHLSLAYYGAERRDFRQLVFLIAQPIDRITAYELRSELDLRVSITKDLALQAVLPISVRAANIELQDVVVSRAQLLPGQTLALRSAGVADATLALGYRVLEHGSFRLQLDGGTRIPFDDNPGSPVLAERIPLGTGQNQLFIGAGASVMLGRVDLSLAYRFEYHPGSTATYLVREVGEQGYTSGALDLFSGHRVSASLQYVFDHMWSVLLAPDFHAQEQPRLVERAGTTTFLPARFRYELQLDASIEARFGWQNALRLGWSQPLLQSWVDDPFFPITVPEQGVRLTWLFRAR